MEECTKPSQVNDHIIQPSRSALVDNVIRGESSPRIDASDDHDFEHFHENMFRTLSAKFDNSKDIEEVNQAFEKLEKSFIENDILGKNGVSKYFLKPTVNGEMFKKYRDIDDAFLNMIVGHPTSKKKKTNTLPLQKINLKPFNGNIFSVETENNQNSDDLFSENGEEEFLNGDTYECDESEPDDGNESDSEDSNSDLELTQEIYELSDSESTHALQNIFSSENANHKLKRETSTPLNSSARGIQHFEFNSEHLDLTEKSLVKDVRVVIEKLPPNFSKLQLDVFQTRADPKTRTCPQVVRQQVARKKTSGVIVNREQKKESASLSKEQKVIKELSSKDGDFVPSVFDKMTRSAKRDLERVLVESTANLVIQRTTQLISEKIKELAQNNDKDSDNSSSEEENTENDIHKTAELVTNTILEFLTKNKGKKVDKSGKEVLEETAANKLDGINAENEILSRTNDNLALHSQLKPQQTKVSKPSTISLKGSNLADAIDDAFKKVIDDKHVSKKVTKSKSSDRKKGSSNVVNTGSTLDASDTVSNSEDEHGSLTSKKEWPVMVLRNTETRKLRSRHLTNSRTDSAVLSNKETVEEDVEDDIINKETRAQRRSRRNSKCNKPNYFAEDVSSADDSDLHSSTESLVNSNIWVNPAHEVDKISPSASHKKKNVAVKSLKDSKRDITENFTILKASADSTTSEIADFNEANTITAKSSEDDPGNKLLEEIVPNKPLLVESSCIFVGHKNEEMEAIQEVIESKKSVINGSSLVSKDIVENHDTLGANAFTTLAEPPEKLEVEVEGKEDTDLEPPVLIPEVAVAEVELGEICTSVETKEIITDFGNKSDLNSFDDSFGTTEINDHLQKPETGVDTEMISLSDVKLSSSPEENSISKNKLVVDKKAANSNMVISEIMKEVDESKDQMESKLTVDSKSLHAELQTTNIHLPTFIEDKNKTAEDIAVNQELKGDNVASSNQVMSTAPEHSETKPEAVEVKSDLKGNELEQNSADQSLEDSLLQIYGTLVNESPVKNGDLVSEKLSEIEDPTLTLQRCNEIKELNRKDVSEDLTAILKGKTNCIKPSCKVTELEAGVCEHHANVKKHSEEIEKEKPSKSTKIIEVNQNSSLPSKLMSNKEKIAHLTRRDPRLNDKKIVSVLMRDPRIKKKLPSEEVEKPDFTCEEKSLCETEEKPVGKLPPLNDDKKKLDSAVEEKTKTRESKPSNNVPDTEEPKKEEINLVKNMKSERGEPVKKKKVKTIDEELLYKTPLSDLHDSANDRPSYHRTIVRRKPETSKRNRDKEHTEELDKKGPVRKLKPLMAENQEQNFDLPCTSNPKFPAEPEHFYRNYYASSSEGREGFEESFMRRKNTETNYPINNERNDYSENQIYSRREFYRRNKFSHDHNHFSDYDKRHSTISHETKFNVPSTAVFGTPPYAPVPLLPEPMYNQYEDFDQNFTNLEIDSFSPPPSELCPPPPLIRSPSPERKWREDYHHSPEYLRSNSPSEDDQDEYRGNFSHNYERDERHHRGKYRGRGSFSGRGRTQRIKSNNRSRNPHWEEGSPPPRKRYAYEHKRDFDHSRWRRSPSWSPERDRRRPRERSLSPPYHHSSRSPSPLERFDCYRDWSSKHNYYR